MTRPLAVRLLRRVGGVLLLFAAAGAAAGALWEWWWRPPTGVVVDGEFLLDGEGLQASFSATASYVLVAVAAGLLLGVGVALRTRDFEVVTLAAVVAGSVLAAWLMYQVGTALDPPDPEALASRAEDGRRLPDDLEVGGSSPHVALPGGALLGLTVAYLGFAGRRRDG